LHIIPGVFLSEGKIKPESGKSESVEAPEKRKGDASRKVEKGAAETEALEERLQAAEAKAEDNHDRFLRVMAEFENYKKRMDREMNDYRKYANESLIKDILPIVDNLQRALQITDENNEKVSSALREGVEMTLKGLLTSLEKFGVVPFESQDKPFDPNFHHAVMREESAGHSENTVVQELQKGYLIGDRLLRPAMVTVSKKTDSESEDKSENPEDPYKIDVTIQ
jgi:molecular chaperone GrpE